ncbi:hypothetical protein VULLAG_LOCUS7599 [Vulpes lagopus]
MCKLLLQTLDPSSSRSLPTSYQAHPSLLPPPHSTNTPKDNRSPANSLHSGTSPQDAVQAVKDSESERMGPAAEHPSSTHQPARRRQRGEAEKPLPSLGHFSCPGPFDSRDWGRGASS